MNGLKHNSGFSFIEMMIVMAIIAVVTIIVVPRFTGFSIDRQRMAFLEQLNAVTSLGWQQALLTGKLHRVLLDFKQRQIRLEQEDAGTVTPVTVGNGLTVVAIPDNMTITNVVVEGDDVMRHGKRATAWYYVVPQGLAQAVEMAIRDDEGEWRVLLNPFTAQFSLAS